MSEAVCAILFATVHYFDEWFKLNDLKSLRLKKKWWASCALKISICANEFWFWSNNANSNFSEIYSVSFLVFIKRKWLWFTAACGKLSATERIFGISNYLVAAVNCIAKHHFSASVWWSSVQYMASTWSSSGRASSGVIHMELKTWTRRAGNQHHKKTGHRNNWGLSFGKQCKHQDNLADEKISTCMTKFQATGNICSKKTYEGKDIYSLLSITHFKRTTLFWWTRSFRCFLC